MNKRDYHSQMQSCYNEFLNFANKQSIYRSCNYKISDRNIQINYSNVELLKLLDPAISHLKSSAELNADLIITVCEQRGSELAAPNISELIRKYESKYSTSETSQPLYYFHNNNIQLCYQCRSEVTEVCFLNQDTKHAIVWISDSSHFSANATDCLSSPFRTIFSWHFQTRGDVIVHSAAIGNPKGGVLLIGSGGAGKTNTSLACLGSKLRFAGDDSILVSLGEIPVASSLYCSARLFPEDLKYFELSKDNNLNYNSGDKIRLILEADFSDKIIKSFPIRALIAPFILVGSETKLEVIAPSEALRILAPSSLLHIPGQNQAALGAMARLANTLPCYRLRVGNRADIAKLIEDLLGL